MTKLAERLQRVEERIAAACRRAGRERADVKLVAVTKSVDVETARQLVELGVRDLGENRPQELWRKASALPGDVCWHLIGHLQRNKVEKTLPLATMIHSVDSWRLLESLEQEAARQSRTIDVLLECNASGEASKQGFALKEVPALALRIATLQCLRVLGLMTMAAYNAEPENCRATFAALRSLRDELRTKLAPPHTMVQLSMGMSNDFEVAIEEGATIIRLGTVLFAPGS
ncbi:MAG TPA: YggS family pyridoxal phosphate-dependent enzyme [Gemmataceae bacterium]|nr:YggS family pyridoxal phosphate-dependent enzyme [Gemmataceae bacterium]